MSLMPGSFLSKNFIGGEGSSCQYTSYLKKVGGKWQEQRGRPKSAKAGQGGQEKERSELHFIAHSQPSL